jgi:hypothetical protein
LENLDDDVDFGGAWKVLERISKLKVEVIKI